jgi:hypothetical protein
VVEICAVPYDLRELGKRVTACGTPIFVRCQISADDGWTCIPVRQGGRVPTIPSVPKLAPPAR